MKEATISVEINLSVVVIVIGIFLMNLFKKSEDPKKRELNLLP